MYLTSSCTALRATAAPLGAARALQALPHAEVRWGPPPPPVRDLGAPPAQARALQAGLRDAKIDQGTPPCQGAGGSRGGQKS
eukprot:CAMPEP_0173180494 /NCGR_PEP_ID=MMETSP1141-20130122/6743_1 /TAXON_ID=483371 /ORGANISM="non described non described, Strain CCMP2298" /LENGTH=81 /DNA_ID=CAMNT_0014103343 /DNA_START=1189 /DNA_END=1435 /DNA_ORIENTATION=-